jgi:hypothetical protein
MHDERYAVRNAEIERALRTLGTLIDGEVPDGWAWGLFLARFGEHEAAPAGSGAVFWISNGDRAGMVDAIKGWIADMERRGVDLRVK